MKRKLPKLNKARVTGITSVELLTSTLSNVSITIPIPVDKDLGIDMRCEVLNEGYPTGIHFNVQCKGTEKLKVDKEFFSIPIEISTINYWLQQREPTFLILVDRENSVFYWTYPFTQVKDNLDELQKQKTVNIRIFKRDFFKSDISSIPIKMINIMFEYHSNILEKIAETAELAITNQERTSLNESPIQKYVSIASSIEIVLKNIEILDNVNKNLIEKISGTIDKEIKQYWNAIIALDYIPEVRRYVKADNIADDTGFGAMGLTPRTAINDVSNAWEKYKEKGYLAEDLTDLNGCLKNLYDMNRHLTYFLKEMLIENDPYGDYDSVTDRF